MPKFNFYINWIVFFVFFFLVNARGQAQTQCNYSTVFTEDFEYTTNIPGVVSATIYHLAPQTYAAHTGAKGMYMNFINGLASNTLVYTKTLTVCSNSQYRLSAWFKLSFGGSSTIKIRIKDGSNNVLSVVTNTYPSGGAWTQYSSVITPTTSTIIFELIYIGGFGGNDLGMDDLTLELCTPTISNGVIYTCAIAPAFNLFNLLVAPNDTIGTWSGPSALGNGYVGTFNPASNDTGLYSYLITNPVAGCPDSTGNITVVFNNGGPQISLGVDTSLCVGDTLVLDANFINSTYVWSTGDTSSAISVTSSGIYWVQVSDLCGVTIDTINVVFNPMPVVNVGNDTLLCVGDTLVLDATYSGATYLWQNNTVDSVFTATQSGTYWVEVTSNNCIATDTIIATFITNPVVNLGPDVTICQGDSILLLGAYPSSTYLWQDGSTNATLVAQLAGQYWVEVTKSICTVSDTMNLSIDPLPSVNLGADTILCDGDSLVLDAFNAASSYLWQDNSTIANLTVTQSGLYWVQVSYNACVSSDSINVFFTPIPVIALGNDTSICDGNSITLFAGFSGASYLWQDNSTNPTFVVSSFGQYHVTVSLGICDFSDTILVNLDPIPSVYLGKDTAICPSDNFLLSLNNPGANFIWQDGSILNYFQVQTNGNYWVQVEKNGCINSDTIFVGSYSIPSVYLGMDTIICSSDSFLLDASYQNATYLWSNSSTDPSIYASNDGIYWVEVTNICGTVKDELEVRHVVIPTADLGDDRTLCLEEWVDLDAGFPGASYLWQDSSTLSYYTVESTGTYWVKVYNHCGFFTDTVQYEFEYCGCEFYIPNSFTPNGDGLNDTFLPYSNCEIWGYYFAVVDRWGNEVFTTMNPELGWDGFYNGKKSANGSYSYIIKFNYKKGGKRTPYQVLHGKVVLLR